MVVETEEVVAGKAGLADSELCASVIEEPGSIGTSLEVSRPVLVPESSDAGSLPNVFDVMVLGTGELVVIDPPALSVGLTDSEPGPGVSVIEETGLMGELVEVVSGLVLVPDAFAVPSLPDVIDVMVI